MDNVEFKMVEGKLHIIVDPKKTFGTSGSGKSTIIGSTRGSQKVTVKDTGDTISVSVNVYKALGSVQV